MIFPENEDKIFCFGWGHRSQVANRVFSCRLRILCPKNTGSASQAWIGDVILLIVKFLFLISVSMISESDEAQKSAPELKLFPLTDDDLIYELLAPKQHQTSGLSKSRVSDPPYFEADPDPDPT